MIIYPKSVMKMPTSGRKQTESNTLNRNRNP